jgi:hypothetical protein
MYQYIELKLIFKQIKAHIPGDLPVCPIVALFAINEDVLIHLKLFLKSRTFFEMAHLPFSVAFSHGTIQLNMTD